MLLYLFDPDLKKRCFELNGVMYERMLYWVFLSDGHILHRVSFILLASRLPRI